MSSPFSKKFHSYGKDPLKMLGDLNKDGKMSGWEQARQDKIEENSSPATMHGKVQDKIDKARKKFERKGEEGDFYEMHQDLYTELSEAKKSHSDKVSKDPEQESAERDESMSREMNEPSPNQKKKCSKRSYK